SFTNLAVYACGDLGVSPNYPTDTTFFSHHGDYTGATISGLFKFTGGGVSYSQVMPAANPTAFDDVNQFVLSPAYGTDQTLMVATGAGLYISTDGGTTFELSSG